MSVSKIILNNKFIKFITNFSLTFFTIILFYITATGNLFNQKDYLNLSDAEYTNIATNIITAKNSTADNLNNYFAANNPLTTDPTYAVGSIPGSFTVDGTGSSNYNIPISVAPGTAGITPALSIIYNSKAGNGLLGMGFNLKTHFTQLRFFPHNFKSIIL